VLPPFSVPIVSRSNLQCPTGRVITLTVDDQVHHRWSRKCPRPLFLVPFCIFVLCPLGAMCSRLESSTCVCITTLIRLISARHDVSSHHSIGGGTSFRCVSRPRAFVITTLLNGGVATSTSICASRPRAFYLVITTLLNGGGSTSTSICASRPRAFVPRDHITVLGVGTSFICLTSLQVLMCARRRTRSPHATS
jgi:hypothetical protein